MSRLKDRRYKFGQDYAWRVVRLEALGNQCRILILLNESKLIMRARMGVELNGDMVVLCEYEYHASEPGWHCHVTLEEATSAPAGAARRDKKKWPRKSSRLVFGVDRANALTLVADRFGFEAQGELIDLAYGRPVPDNNPVPPVMFGARDDQELRQNDLSEQPRSFPASCSGMLQVPHCKPHTTKAWRRGY